MDKPCACLSCAGTVTTVIAQMEALQLQMQLDLARVAGLLRRR